MLTRRLFGGCALCAGLGLLAAGVDAGAAAAQTAGITRTILKRIEFPGNNYVTILARAEIAPGGLVARHTHPGVETSYVLAGHGTLLVQGRADQAVGPGDDFQIPPLVPHSARNGDAAMVIVTTYVVEKDKPLASPAPE
jgi:quercetin dioxygenase-like cupin family protein